MIAGAATIPFGLTPTTAQSQEKRQTRAAVFISTYESWHYETNEFGRYAVTDGMVVEYVSASSNLPTVQPGTSIGDALAVYLDAGCSLTPQHVSRWDYILTR